MLKNNYRISFHNMLNEDIYSFHVLLIGALMCNKNNWMVVFIEILCRYVSHYNYCYYNEQVVCNLLKSNSFYRDG